MLLLKNPAGKAPLKHWDRRTVFTHLRSFWVSVTASWGLPGSWALEARSFRSHLFPGDRRIEEGFHTSICIFPMGKLKQENHGQQTRKAPGIWTLVCDFFRVERWVCNALLAPCSDVLRIRPGSHSASYFPIGVCSESAFSPGARSQISSLGLTQPGPPWSAQPLSC